MANSKVNMIKKGFVRYAHERYPEEAEAIVRRAEELYPVLHAKAPDIGGAENLMAYNLDMLILAVSFYEASDHRMDGAAFQEIARDMARRYGIVKKLVNLVRPLQALHPLFEAGGGEAGERRMGQHLAGEDQPPPHRRGPVLRAGGLPPGGLRESQRL